MTSASNYAKPPPLDLGWRIGTRNPHKKRNTINITTGPGTCSTAAFYSMLLLIIEFAFYRHLYTRVQFGSGQSVGCVAERGDTRDHTPVEQQQWLIVAIQWADGRHLDIVSTPSTVCPAVLVCNHDRTTAWTLEIQTVVAVITSLTRRNLQMNSRHIRGSIKHSFDPLPQIRARSRSVSMSVFPMLCVR